jgi:hypothetical protein
MKNLVKESLEDYRSVKEEINDLKQKVMYAQMFHPEKAEIYMERLKELEGELPANTIDESCGVGDRVRFDNTNERGFFFKDTGIVKEIREDGTCIIISLDGEKVRTYTSDVVSAPLSNTKRKRQKWTRDDKDTKEKRFSGGYEKSSWSGPNPTNK